MARQNSTGSGKSGAASRTKAEALKASEKSRSAADRFRDMTARRAEASTTTPLMRLAEEGQGAIRAPEQTVAQEGKTPALSVVPEPSTVATTPVEEPSEGGEEVSAEEPQAAEQRAVRDERAPAEADTVPEQPEEAVAEPVKAPAKKAAQKRAAPKAPKNQATEEEERLQDLLLQISGPESRLERTGEPVKKLTLELPIPLVDAMARWELDIVRSTGRRIYRERLFDLALAALPEDDEEVIEIGRSLPTWLKYAETEQLGARARESLVLRLRTIAAEMKVRRTRGVFLRHIQAAALENFLAEYGVRIESPTDA